MEKKTNKELMAANKKAAKALVKKYRSVTGEEIDNARTKLRCGAPAGVVHMDDVMYKITGFGSSYSARTGSCTARRCPGITGIT